jgi:hypothetical protein
MHPASCILHPAFCSQDYSLSEVGNLGNDDVKPWMIREFGRVINQAEFQTNGRVAADGIGGVWVEDAQQESVTAGAK